MTRHPNFVTTRPKHVCLTPEGRAAVQDWADAQGVSFSAAIETLARLGLGQAPHDAWGPALVSKVVGAVRQDLGRIAGLFAATAIDAGVTARLAGAALKTLRPKDYQAIKQAARLEAVDLLRRRDARAELGLLEEDGGAAAEDGVAGGAPVAVAGGRE